MCDGYCPEDFLLLGHCFPGPSARVNRLSLEHILSMPAGDVGTAYLVWDIREAMRKPREFAVQQVSSHLLLPSRALLCVFILSGVSGG